MKNEAKRKIRVSIVISIVSLFASIFLTFFFNKFLLNQPQIGDVNYGLKSTVDSLTSFVSIFVLGMSSTFIRFHRKYEDDENSLFSSFNVIILAICTLALIFGIIVVLLSMNNIILDPSKGVYTQKQVYDFTIILIISLFFLILSMILSCNKWYLESVKSIVFVRLVNLICIILYPLISIIFVLNGADMIGVTIIYSVVYLCGFLSYLIYRLIKTRKSNPFVVRRFKKEIIKEIIVFSFFVVIASFIETFNHSVDKLILTIGFSAIYTTIYQLSMSINQVLLSLCDTLYAPYIPYLSDDAKNNDIKSTQHTYDKVSFLLLLLSFTLIVGFFAAGKDFVILWLGETRIDVYYYALVIFLAWPVYCIAKFSLQIHRVYNKHYKSAILFVFSFVVHLIVTFSLIWVVGVWACIIGTAASMLFLGISFIVYNKKQLNIKQNKVLVYIIKFLIASIITCLIMFAMNYVIDKSQVGSNLVLLVAKGFLSFFLWLIICCLIFFNKTKSAFKTFFVNQYDEQGTLIQQSKWVSFKKKIVSKKDKINRCFPFVFIVYFIFNFASYYLGGIEQISTIVLSPYFEYGTKLISYLLIVSYFVVFFISNECKINKIAIILVISTIIASIISIIVVPKQLSIETLNKYNMIIALEYNAGIIELGFGLINYCIDLFVMLFYVLYIKKAISYDSLRPFIIFIIVFASFECIYSIIFDFSDYLFFFQSKTDASSGFNGYSTNISGTFSSKNGFGFLLFGSIVCSVFDLYKTKKWFLILPILLILTVSVFSLCKTSLIATLLFLGFALTAYLIHLKKTKKRLFWFFIGLFVFLLTFFGLMFTPLFKSVPFINRISSKITSIFFVSGEATTRSRTYIWLQTLQLLMGPYIVFGYGKAISLNMLSLATNFTTVSYHNSILNTLCCYGVVGLVVYIYALITVFNSLLVVKNRMIRIVLIGCFISSFLYGMMETATLFVSSSSTLIISNIILSLRYERNTKLKESICYEVINI